MTTLDGQVEALFPLGGPYDADTTRAAAESIAALVRYLNHATYHAESVPEPATVDAVLRSLAAGTSGLDQLLRQLGQQLDGQVGRFGGRLYSDDGRDAVGVAAAVLGDLGVARRRLTEAAAHLQDAAGQSSHLGVGEVR